MGDRSLDGLEAFVDAWLRWKLFYKKEMRKKKELCLFESLADLLSSSVCGKIVFFCPPPACNVNPCFKNSNNTCGVSPNRTDADWELKSSEHLELISFFLFSFFLTDGWAQRVQTDNSKHGKAPTQPLRLHIQNYRFCLLAIWLETFT